MAKDIEPKLKFISDYLKINKNEEFIIPEYQRGYSWSIVQCDKLWQDVEDFIESGMNDPYFFGTIIVDCSETEKFCLIDGQQRTTTFLLLLKALQLRIKEVLDKLKSYKDDDTEQLKKFLNKRYESIIEILYKADDEETYEIIDNWNIAKGVSLLLNKSINEQHKEELQIIIEAKDFTEAERNCYKIPRKQKDNKYTNFFRNFKFFYEKLGYYRESQLNSFAKAFLSKCQIIEIRSWQIEQAITMFNSLNSTGMPLSDADIISAQLYSNVDGDKTDFNQKWENITHLASELGTRKIISIDSVLQQYMYIVRAKSQEYLKKGYTDVTTPGLRNYYTNINKGLLKSPIDLCNEFEKITKIWDKIKDYPIVKLLLKFNENAKLYLISYLNRFDLNSISEPVVKDIAECLIRLFTILELVDAGYSSTSFKTFLFSENTKLVDGAVSIDDIKKDFDSHINKTWDPSVLQSLLMEYDKNVLVFLNEYLYVKSTNEKIKAKRDKALANNESLETEQSFLKFDFLESVNIEHIMPASGHNLEAIRKDAGIGSREEFDSIVNKLGNKILLEEDINKSIGKEWFQTKKQTSIKDKSGYKDSAYHIARALVNYPTDTWSKDDIEEATQKATLRILQFVFNNQDIETSVPS